MAEVPGRLETAARWAGWVVLAVACAAAPLWGGRPGLWPIWLTSACCLAAAGLCGAERVGRLLGWVAALLGAVAALAPFAAVPFAAVAWLLFAASLVAAAVSIRDMPAWLALGALFAGGALAGVWAAREYATTAIVLGELSWRPFGPFFNPNALAGYLLVALPAGVAFVSWLGRRGWRVGVLAAAPIWAVSAGAFVLAGSKGAALGAIAASVVVARGRRRAVALAAAALAVAAAMAVPPMRARIVGAFSGQRGTSLAFRWQTWRGTWRMAAARPLTGWGLGSFKYVYPRFALVPFTAMAHNTWLQAAAEIGFPLAAGAALAALAALGRLAGGAGTGRVAAWALAAVAVHNLMDYTAYLPAVALSLVVLCAAGRGGGEEANRSSWADRRNLLWRLSCVAGFAVALWMLRADALYALGQRHARQGLVLVGEAELRAAAQAAAFCPDYWWELGRLAEAQQRLAEAERCYRLAIACAPDWPAGWVALARVLRASGRGEEAVAAAAEAARRYPRGSAALMELARCLEAAGREGEALRVWRQVAELADAEYGRYTALEGWADWRLAVAAAVVARHEKGQAAAVWWRKAGEILERYLSWRNRYAEAMAAAGEWDAALAAELAELAAEIARNLEATGRRDDAALARRLRELAEGL